jgi:spore coat polysaccharide biosynthesis predicted glycosyltransferase SpsG
MKELFVLASGNAKIGLGHIHRSLLLSSALSKRGIKVNYFNFDNDYIAENFILNCGTLIPCSNSDVENPNSILQIITNTKSALTEPLLYIDSDQKSFYASEYQKTIVRAGVKLMYATLYSEFHYYAHILLNQNIIALTQQYSTEDYTNRLLGPKYFLWKESAKTMVVKPDFKQEGTLNIFVNFGNADPNDLTSKLVTTLNNSLHLFSEVTVVVGSLYQGIDNLETIIQKEDGSKFRLLKNADNMFDLMQQADIAISSMGMTFWELTYQNIPSVILSGSVRERIVCDFMNSENYAFKLGDFEDVKWQEDWNTKLKLAFKNRSLEKLKTKELQKQVNINGVDSVVKFMVAV